VYRCRKGKRRREKAVQPTPRPRLEKEEGEGEDTLQRQASPVASPPVQRKEFPPALMLLAEVLGHAAAHLGESAAHDAAKVAL
jgi:hypothetical protein